MGIACRRMRSEMARRSARGPSARAVATISSRSDRGSAPATVPYSDEPSAVLRGAHPAHAHQPSHEVRFGFVGVAGEMAPLVRDRRGALERQQRLIRERLEKKRIGHAVDRHAREVEIEERPLRTARARPSTASQDRAARARTPARAWPASPATRANPRRARRGGARSASRRCGSRAPAARRA